MDKRARQIAFSPGNTTRRLTKRLAVVAKLVESTNHESWEEHQTSKHLHSLNRSRLNAARVENNETEKNNNIYLVPILRHPSVSYSTINRRIDELCSSFSSIFFFSLFINYSMLKKERRKRTTNRNRREIFFYSSVVAFLS